MEANAALRAIVRRDTSEGYREMLKRLAKENWIETPTADDLVRLQGATSEHGFLLRCQWKYWEPRTLG
jgi:hypothetical protein